MSNDHATLDENAIVSAARNDPASFEPLYERYALPIYRYCFTQVHDVELANDLTASVFIRAIERLDQYRPRRGATFRNWLFAIARNLMVDEWRRARTTRPVEVDEVELVEPSPGPEEVAVHRTHMETVFSAIDRLPQRYREIIHLRLAGLTTPEVAAVLGISESAMKSAQTRAYRQLRSMISPPGGIE